MLKRLVIAAVILATPASAQQFFAPPPLPTTREVVAALTVTATNTLSALPQPYDGRFCRLFVNGQLYTDKDTTPAFSVPTGSKTITWNTSALAGVLSTDMSVTADCSY